MKHFNFIFFSIICTTAFGQVTNLRAGVWSDVTLWSNNAIPTANDTVSLQYDIVIDIDAECKVFNANGHNVTVNTGYDLAVLGVSPVPDSTFTDSRDGQVYTFRHIGTQVWMTKNLNYITASGSYCYNNAGSNCAIYGRLYDWNTALAAVPSGWHLPTSAEWRTLINYLGGDTIAGGKMKEVGTLHWTNPNTGADNSSGFSGLPGGYRLFNGMFDVIGVQANWWSSTGQSGGGGYAIYRGLNYDNAIAGEYGNISGSDFFSVRCIRD